MIPSPLQRARRLAMALVVVAAAGCGNGVVATPAASGPATIDAFLEFARSPDQRFAVAVTGEFMVGSQRITYDLTGSRSGPNAIETGTQAIDGEPVAFGTAYVGGHLYGVGQDGGWTFADATPEIAALFADGFLSFEHALVLEDLGVDPSAGGHRLGVSAGFSLFPPQASLGAIPDAHDVSDHLELLVSDAGLPLEGTYTYQLTGTIDGNPGTASGMVRYVFSDVGGAVDIPTPSVAPGTSVPPVVARSVAPGVTWQSYSLAYASYAVDLPGVPEVSTRPIENPNLGSLEETTARGETPDGTPFSVIETVLPGDYLASRGARAVLDGSIEIEAANLGATVLGTRPVETDGVPGVEAVLTDGGNLYRLRVYVFDTSTVEIGVGGRIPQVANAIVDQFLGSLVPAG